MHNHSEYNLHQQDIDLEIINALIPYLTNKTFIDVGAEKGTFTDFLSKQGLKGVLFEPLPAFAPELSTLALKTGSTFLPYAIDSHDRTADFYSAADTANSSAYHFSSLHPLNNDPRITHTKATTVICRSLDSLYEKNEINGNIGLLKIDTEGNDLNVLKGMTKFTPEILMCEYFMPGIYKGWEQAHPIGIIEHAKKFGFEHFVCIKRADIYELLSIDNSTFYPKQWGNLIFMNKQIFASAKPTLDRIVAENGMDLIKKTLDMTESLRTMCSNKEKLISLMSKEALISKHIKTIRSAFLRSPLFNFKKFIKYIFNFRN